MSSPDETRVAKVEMDDKDRHVLAAALSANAGLLLTQNVRHFPREWMAKRGIELVNAASNTAARRRSGRASCNAHICSVVQT